MRDDDALGAALGVLLLATVVITIVCMSQCAGVTSEKWEAASKECSYGVEKVYNDGDYDCKKQKAGE